MKPGSVGNVNRILEAKMLYESVVEQTAGQEIVLLNLPERAVLGDADPAG